MGQTSSRPRRPDLHVAGQRFRVVPGPGRLQAICDRLGAEQIQGFFDRWMAVIPTPLPRDDRDAYWCELSMRQIEVSRTIVFDDPRRARGFFESLVADNVGIGRPSEVAVVFARQVHKTTKEPFRTRVFTPGTEVKMDFAYKHSRVEQYLKEREGAAHRDRHQQRAGQGCAIGSALFERIQQPYVREGQRTGALRSGDTRGMALTGALAVFIHAVAGFTNKSLRSLVAGLLDVDYTPSQMSYDLRRLRLHGIIERLLRTNTYVLTPDGARVALFYSKVHARLLRPLLAADQPPAPLELRRALATIDRSIADYITNARLGTAA